MKKLLILVVLTVALSINSYAQETDVEKGGFSTLIESSQLMVGLGYANISYPKELENAFEDAESHFGGIGLNIAWYVPLPTMNNTAIGIDVTGALDFYTYTGTSASVTTNHELSSISLMHFFGKEIGSGPFIKADVGLSRMQVNVSDIFMDIEATTDYGLGLLLGGGIAFPILGKGEILLNADYSFRRIEGDNYNIIGLGLGYLWYLY